MVEAHSSFKLEKMVGDMVEKYFVSNGKNLSRKISVEESIIEVIEKQLGKRVTSLEKKSVLI